jgi:KUP system potassium uptake protein
MVSIVAIICWRFHPLIVLAGFVIFASLDGLYLSSALTKIPDGAWVTLMLAVILSGIALLWRYGKELQWKQRSARTSLGQLIGTSEDGGSYLKKNGGRLTNIKGRVDLNFLFRMEVSEISAG